MEASKQARGVAAHQVSSLGRDCYGATSLRCHYAAAIQWAVLIDGSTVMLHVANSMRRLVTL